MEISQGNTLLPTFISNKRKYHVFILLFSFLFLQNHRMGGLAPVGGGSFKERE
jgi:hypothetical protein